MSVYMHILTLGLHKHSEGLLECLKNRKMFASTTCWSKETSPSLLQDSFSRFCPAGQLLQLCSADYGQFFSFLHLGKKKFSGILIPVQIYSNEYQFHFFAKKLTAMAELKLFKVELFHLFLLFIGQCHEDTLKFRMLLHQGSYFSCFFSSLLPQAAVDSQLNNTSLSGEHVCISKGGIKKNTFQSKDNYLGKRNNVGTRSLRGLPHVRTQIL